MIVDNRPLRGWRLWLLTATLALGTIVALANVPGYTITVPYVSGSLGGVNPSFGAWGTTDHMVGLALGLPFARWFSGRFGDYRAYVAAFLLYAVAAWVCAASETLWQFLPGRIALGFIGGVGTGLPNAPGAAGYFYKLPAGLFRIEWIDSEGKVAARSREFDVRGGELAEVQFTK